MLALSVLNIKFLSASVVLVLLTIINTAPVSTSTGTTQAPQTQVASCSAREFTGLIVPNPRMAYFEGKNLKVPNTLAKASLNTNRVLGVASPEEKWIEVDLSEQKIRVWDGTNLFLESLVSTGLPGTRTPIGEFRIWVKLRAAKMEGGSGSGYYYLPNVPYIMYFGNDEVPNYKGYGLHGTYWHNDFGTPKSHGCVNLPTEIAEQIYYWATPVLEEGKGAAFADENNQGTRIIIHE